MQIDTVQTKDNKLYKIEREVFAKYSNFFKTMIQDSDEETFMLYTIKSEEFDYIY